MKTSIREKISLQSLQTLVDAAVANHYKKEKSPAVSVASAMAESALAEALSMTIPETLELLEKIEKSSPASLLALQYFSPRPGPKKLDMQANVEKWTKLGIL